MGMQHPEEHFRQGKIALANGRAVRASAHFHDAIAEEDAQNPVRRQMRYLSYYGLALSLAYKPKREYVELCERASKEDPFDAELQANLAKVYLLARKKTRALDALVRGIRLDPANGRLRKMLESVDRRRAPLVPALGRDHFLNRTAGRWRHRLFSRSANA